MSPFPFPDPPADFKVGRTVNNDLRIELPRRQGSIGDALTAGLFLSVFVAGGCLGLYVACVPSDSSNGIGWAQADVTWAVRACLCCFMLMWMAVPILGLGAAVLGALERGAVEVGEESLVLCSRLPLFPEKRRPVSLDQLVAVTMGKYVGKRGLVTPFLAVFGRDKDYAVGTGLPCDSLSWLGGLLAAAADRKQGTAPGKWSLQDTLGRDLLLQRLVNGYVLPDSRDALKSDSAPPAGSNVQVISEGGGELRVRMIGARTRGGFLLGLGVFMAFVVGVFAVFFGTACFGLFGGIGGHWVLPVTALTTAAAASICIIRIARRRRVPVEVIEEVIVSPEAIAWERRVSGRTESERLAGPGLRMWRKEFYARLGRASFGIEITGRRGESIVIGESLRPDVVHWLIARLAAVLGPKSVKG